MVATTEKMPSWLKGCLSKNEREAMECLRDLLEAAQARGHCTAEDITHNPAEPNVVGSVFKRLRSCGLKQGNERVKPTQKQKHGRLLWKWEVDRWDRLESVLTEIQRINRTLLINEPPAVKNQLLLGY